MQLISHKVMTNAVISVILKNFLHSLVQTWPRKRKTAEKQSSMFKMQLFLCLSGFDHEFDSGSGFTVDVDFHEGGHRYEI